jgi:hypothetical protein
VSNKPLNISESAAVQMPMKTVVSLIALVAIGTWAYFGLHETLNKHSTQIELMQKDADQEQFMMIEDLYKSVDRLNKAIEDGMHNKVNIEFLQKQVEKAIIDIEDLKDANREIVYKNGNGQ